MRIFLKANFKKDTQKHFRDKLILFINDKYIFFKATPITTSSTDELISKYFKTINGKVYKPSQLNEELIFAFEKLSDYSSIVDIIKPDTVIFEEYVIS